MAERDDSDNDQQRQIRNLQGLLNFCTEITAREDTTQDTPLTQLSEERRQFLENVFSGMQGNVAKEMANCLHKLLEDCVEDVEQDISAQEEALDQLAEYGEDINYAIDLYKLNGFPILVQILKCPHPSLQRGAAQVIGDVCQNNEVCQKNMLPLNVMETLLNIIDTHPDSLCKVKALYALSCLTRDYEPAEQQFEELSGFDFLMRAVQTHIPKLVNKSIFLLNYFIGKTSRHKDTLLSMGFIEQLVNVLFSEELDDTSREYCTLSLLNLCSSYDKALEECLRPEFRLQSQLLDRLSSIIGKEENQEEENHIKAFLKLLDEEEKEDNLIR